MKFLNVPEVTMAHILHLVQTLNGAMIRRNRVLLHDIDIDSAARRVCFKNELQRPHDKRSKI